MGFWFWTAVTAGVIVAWLISRRRTFTIHEYQTGLLYHEGRFQYACGPGREVFWSPQHTMTLVDLRQKQVVIGNQEVLCADHVAIKLSMVLTYRVTDAPRAVHEFDDYTGRIYATAQLALRECVVAHDAEAVLTERKTIQESLLPNIQEEGKKIGLEIIDLSIRDIMLPGPVKKAFSDLIAARARQQVELEKTRAQTAALRNLANAADLIAKNPTLLNLRVLQLLEDLAESNGNDLHINLENLLNHPPTPNPDLAPPTPPKQGQAAKAKKKAAKKAKKRK